MTDAGWIDDRSRDPEPSDGTTIAGMAYLLVVSIGLAGAAAGGDWFWMTLPFWFAALLPPIELLSRHASRVDPRGRASVRGRGRRMAAGSGAPPRGGRRHRRDRVPPVERPRDRIGAYEDAALAVLRERYARGELDEREFERRLAVLVETEDASPGEAADRLRTTRTEDERGLDRN